MKCLLNDGQASLGSQRVFGGVSAGGVKDRGVNRKEPQVRGGRRENRNSSWTF